MPSSTRLLEWVLTINDRRHGHAEQVCRGDPSQFQSDVGSRTFGRSAQGGERRLMQIQTMDQMMDAWEEQIKSPMTGSPSAMLSKLRSLPSVSSAGTWV